jgi:peptidyl-prolyl cis-trans isomerase C
MRIPVSKRILWSAAFLSVALLSLVLLRTRSNQSSASFVARVGDEMISEETFRAEAIRRHVSSPESRRVLLDEMVRDLKLLQHARQKGYDQDPEIAREYRAMLISRAKKDFGVDADTAVGAIADADLQAYYDQHPSEFAVPTRVRAAMIFVATPAGLNPAALAEKRQKIEAARAAIIAAASSAEVPFGAVAVTYSEDQATRYVGGDLGYQVEGMAHFSEDKTAHAALFTLSQPGQLSEIVSGPSGFYVFKLLERNPPSVQPLSMVRERIRSRLQAARRQQKEQAFTAVLAAIPADVRPDALARIVLPEPQLADRRRTTPPPIPGGATTTR